MQTSSSNTGPCETCGAKTSNLHWGDWICDVCKAIDDGGGQTCDVKGVHRALDKAGFVITKKVPDPSGSTPKVVDDDKGQITVTLNGHELRGWSYANDAERRVKMLCAREYVEGWGDGRSTA